MPFGAPIHNMSTAQLQSTLSASTAGQEHSVIVPHHPITCTSNLQYFEDDSMACDHTKTNPKDSRTAACVRHSVVLLLLEPAVSDPDWRYKSPDDLIEKWNKEHPNDPW